MKNPLIRRRRVRAYAQKIAQEWGSDYSRFSPSFFVAVEEAAKRAVAQLVIANNQSKRKTLR